MSEENKKEVFVSLKWYTCSDHLAELGRVQTQSLVCYSQPGLNNPPPRHRQLHLPCVNKQPRSKGIYKRREGQSSHTPPGPETGSPQTRTHVLLLQTRTPALILLYMSNNKTTTGQHQQFPVGPYKTEECYARQQQKQKSTNKFILHSMINSSSFLFLQNRVIRRAEEQRSLKAIKVKPLWY